MKNKKSLLAIITILLIAVVGVTFAYFQSSTSFRNVFDTGYYRLVTTEVFESPDNWKPGEEIPKTIITTNEGTINAAVRVSYTEQWFDSEDNEITSSIEEDSAIINFDNTRDWIQDDGYYKYILKAGESTSSFIKSVTLNDEVGAVTCETEGLTQVCEAGSPALGAKYVLTITKETIQANKFSEWNSSIQIVEKLGIGDNSGFTTTSNGVSLNDWKVFYVDDDYTYLIYADYLPSSAASANALQGLTTYGPYGVYYDGYGDKDPIMNAVATKSYWDELITNGKFNGQSLNLTPSENVYAMGAPTLELWVNSWNNSYPQSRYYIDYYDYDSQFDDYGWFIYTTEDTYGHLYVDSRGKDGENDPLYFPHKDIYEECFGYWLASPSFGFYEEGNGVFSVDYYGMVGDGYYTWSGRMQVPSFRPIVRLPKSALNQ